MQLFLVIPPTGRLKYPPWGALLWLSGAGAAIHSEVQQKSLWGKCVLFLLTSAFRPFSKSKPYAKRGAGPRLLFHRLLTASVFLISVLLRKLSGRAPAETADPNYGSFQGKETPLGQIGSDLSA